MNFDLFGYAVDNCATCGLKKTCKTPEMPVYGEGKQQILLIADAPSKEADRGGHVFADKTGDVLQRLYLTPNKIDFKKDCWSTYALNCLPEFDKNSQTKSKKYLGYCHNIVMRRVNQLKPKKIILMGAWAIRTLLQDRVEHVGAIARWRGAKIPDQELGVWIYPTYSPDYFVTQVKRQEKQFSPLLFHDITQAIKHEESFPEKPKHPFIWLHSEQELINEIAGLENTFAFDYETTGLDPYKNRLICAAFGDSKKTCLFFVKDVKAGAFLEILKDPRYKKVAQNLLFEDFWTRVFFKTKISGWCWDTCVGSHLENFTTDTTNLKFQTYIKFGVGDYSRVINPYLKRGNADTADPESLFKYCCKDVYYTYILYELQIMTMS